MFELLQVSSNELMVFLKLSRKGSVIRMDETSISRFKVGKRNYRTTCFRNKFPNVFLPKISHSDGKRFNCRKKAHALVRTNICTFQVCTFDCILFRWRECSLFTNEISFSIELNNFYTYGYIDCCFGIFLYFHSINIYYMFIHIWHPNLDTIKL